MNAPSLMRKAIEPKSDQINADDLIGGDQIITVTGVKIVVGDQPISISFEGSPKFYRPCKSMARVLAGIWGMDPEQYIGRSMKLYLDPNVKWGGVKVGGIRISEMSHMGDKPVTLALTATRGQRTLTVIRPLLTGFEAAKSAARRGTEAFRVWWNSDEGKAARPEVQPRIKELQAIAAEADAAPPEVEQEPVTDDLGYQPTMEERLRAAQEAAPPADEAEVVDDEREAGEE